jgi:HAD superfamily hydrolase (TIGR01509 family)
MPLRGVLLDIDGTLLDSNAAHAHAWVEAYAQFGYQVLFGRIFPLIGMGGDKLMATLTPGLSTTEGVGKEIEQRRQQVFLKKYVRDLKPTDGARELVERFRSLGLTCTIATSAKDAELQALLKQTGISDLIEHRATSDDAEESKPDPDIVQAALAKSELAPEDVLMLGDTPFDVESAEKAKVGAVAVRCGGHDADLFGALALYDDPADIVLHFDSSPFGQRLAPPTSR